MTALLIYLAIAGTPIGLTLLWVWADEWLACSERAESMSERHERLDAEERAANVAAYESMPKEARR